MYNENSLSLETGLKMGNNWISQFIENDKLEDESIKIKNENDIINNISKNIIRISKNNVDVGVKILRTIIEYDKEITKKEEKLPIKKIMENIRERDENTDKKIIEHLTNVLYSKIV